MFDNIKLRMMLMKKLILCVDDEKIVLNSLKEQLVHQLPNNYKIDIAQSGLEALEVIEEYKTDGYDILLVISDYVMPGMQGDEFLAKVNNQYPESVKILLTGQANLEGISNIINNAGLFRYIQKPWEREDLVLSTLEAIKSFEKDRQIELQNQALKSRNETLEKWANSAVETLSVTLDSRDTTTAGHSKRMSEYAVQIAQFIRDSQSPHFEEVTFDDHAIEALRIASLLHDVGKIGIKEDVLLKSSRITEERMLIISNRFNYLACNLNHHIKNLSKDEILFLNNFKEWLLRLDTINHKGHLIQEDLDFIHQVNKLKIKNPNKDTNNRQFIRLLEEDELENLSIINGNLTKKERKIIESHAELTYSILSNIPWPPELGDIPTIAADHHERLDGSGYYKGLEADEIHVSSKILAVLDVYEALTSKDRPYRKPLSSDKALEILNLEAKKGKMDGNIIQILKEIIDKEA